jgi:hypothetical protein
MNSHGRAIWSAAYVGGIVVLGGEGAELCLHVEPHHIDGEIQDGAWGTHRAERRPEYCPQSEGHAVRIGNQWQISFSTTGETVP